MTPAARIAAAIEILEAAEPSPGELDRVFAAYFRRRRYAGSKDRAFVAARVYGAARRRLRLDWRLGRLGAEPTPRARLLVDLARFWNASAEDMAAFFDGSAHAPPSLSGAEAEMLERLRSGGPGGAPMPLAARVECPDWIARRLRPVLGDRFEACLSGLAEEARFDLRINPAVQPDREAARRALAREGLDCEPTPLSPLGLRAATRRRVEGLAAWKAGAVEVQDEGAQLAAILTGAAPGMQVADLCAGAGGKTLPIAALMENRGRVLAMDVSAERLERAGPRVARAGLHNVERHALKSENDRYLKRRARRFDRVLVDAPCTGIGTWRRRPDARSLYGESDLAAMVDLQDRILASAARLAAPGGRLVYVTCSLLAEENEERVAALLARRPDYRALPIREVWRETVEALGGGPCPADGDALRLAPDLHGTDGFFVAVLERLPAEDGTEDAAA